MLLFRFSFAALVSPSLSKFVIFKCFTLTEKNIGNSKLNQQESLKPLQTFCGTTKYKTTTQKTTNCDWNEIKNTSEVTDKKNCIVIIINYYY